jgi:iron only hydrogenase large subunit-like protein/ferredoxin
MDGQKIVAKEGMSVLEVAKENGIHIPTLCYLKDINEIGACRVCVVEIKGRNNLLTSCTTKIEEGMEVLTSSKIVMDSRRTTMELLLSDHKFACPSCTRDENCGVQKATLDSDLSMYLSVYRNTDFPYFGEKNESPIEIFKSSLEYDESKCIMCRRCISICEKIQKIGALEVKKASFESSIGLLESDDNCIECGQCIRSCPTGALSVIDDREKIEDGLDENSIAVLDKHFVNTICQEFSEDFGGIEEGQLISFVKSLGYKDVYSLKSFENACLEEELKEIVLDNSKVLLSAYCESALKGVDRYIKSDKFKISNGKRSVATVINNMKDRKDVSNITFFTQCINDKNYNSDFVHTITTKEMYKLMKEKSFDYINVESSNYINNQIYLERNIDYKKSNYNGVVEAIVPIEKCKLRVAKVSGMENVINLLDMVLNDEVKYDYITVLACPSGCVNGGGQVHRILDEFEAIK